MLTGAMMAFRRHGFGGLSVKELERATGVSVGSLYNAYGDKSGLYEAAFEHYFATIVEPRLTTATTLEDVESVFLGLFELPMADGHGCLITNAAIEFGAAPSLASEFIGRGLDTLETVLRRVLAHEVGAGAAAIAALRLVLIYQGILVLSRAGRRMDDYAPVVRTEFDRLRSRRTSFNTHEEKPKC